MSKAPTLAFQALASAVKDARSTAAEIASIAVDSAIKSDIFEKVPILGALLNAYDFVDAAIKMKLVRNTVAFLKAAQTDDPKTASKAFDKVYGDPRYRDEIPDTVMQIIAESHKPLKAEMVGRAFSAVGSDKLRVEDFETMCLVILTASIPALRALKQFGDMNPNNNGLEPLFGEEAFLKSAGIAERNRDGLRLTLLGHKLYAFCFGSSVPTVFL